MKFLVVFLSLLGSDDTAEKAGQVEVNGLIATRVKFKEEAKRKVAEAGLAMLTSCSYSHHPNEGELPQWEDIFLDTYYKKCHIHIRFDKPRTIKTAASEKVEVSEMVIVLPLNSGVIWVRSGDKAKRFAKYSVEATLRIQELLKKAEPAESTK
jgi:hypothetical protein